MDISVVVRDRVLLAHESKRLGEMIPVPAMLPVILLFILLCFGDVAAQKRNCKLIVEKGRSI